MNIKICLLRLKMTTQHKFINSALADFNFRLTSNVPLVTILQLSCRHQPRFRLRLVVGDPVVDVGVRRSLFEPV